MILGRNLRVLLSACALASTLFASEADAQSRRRLESFFVTLSDYRILAVRPAGSGVTVRVIQLHYLEDACWTRAMRAYEVTLPDTTLETLAGTRLCALSQRRVDEAIDQSREPFMRSRDGIPWGSSFYSVTAMCKGRERRSVVEHTNQPGVDLPLLRQVDGPVASMVTLGERVALRAAALAPDVATQEAQGTAAAAELLEGHYDQAYRDMCWDGRGHRTRCDPPFWRQILGDYKGPPTQRGPLPPTLLGREPWQFARYVDPEYPRIAISARISGDVRIRLQVDRASGDVTRATIVDGTPLLDHAALAAAKQWQFVANTAPSDPFDVTLRYELKCPAR